MMRKNIVYWVLILYWNIFLISCFHKQEKNYAETFYASGALKSKKWFLKEGIFIDTAYYYYENGNYSSIDILNDSGVLHGVSKIFYENGNIEQIINYTEGVKDGFLYNYTPDGHLNTKNYYLNDKMVGDVFGYNAKGQINYYGFYDFSERNLNLITYDSITGKPIKDMYQDIFIDSLNLNKDKDSFEIHLLLSNPPNCRSSVKIDYVSASGKVIKSDSVSGKSYYLIKEGLNDSLKTIKYFATQYDSLKKENSSQSKNVNVE